jgi:hypothetical protein
MKKILIIFFITLFGVTGRAAETISIRGYYKLFFIGFEMPGYSPGDEALNEPALGAVNNRIRLNVSVTPASWFSLDAAYDFSPRIQDPVLFQEDIFFAAIDPFSYRVDDFSQRIYPGQDEPVGSFGIFHNLDRFFVTIKTSVADIFIGRQAIAWGSARFVNPTDVIAPFTFNELDTEERRGVDAVRVRIPLGMMDELDLGYIIGNDFKFRSSAFYLRGKTYLFKTDISAVLMAFRENLLVGLDVARSVGGAGAWLEAAYVVPDFFAGGGKNYFRASLGLDYNFSGKLYGFCEYHYNSAGKKKPGEYADAFFSTAYSEGATYLMGQHYLNLGITTQLTALIPFTALVVVNLSDGSITLSPALEYNIAENIYLSGGAYLGIGKAPEIIPGSLPGRIIRFHSEFGAYPAMVYTSFRVYF